VAPGRGPTITAAVFLAVLLLGAVAACHRQTGGDLAEAQTPATVGVSSSSFSDGGRIPQKFTCDGSGTSPDIQLSSASSDTKSLLLVMDDPDASGFVHWLLYNIPPATRDIPEGASAQIALPAGAAEGENSIHSNGYFGPCPPAPNPHHYVFSVYALDADLKLPPGQTKKELASAIKGHVLAKGSMTGLYTRGGG